MINTAIQSAIDSYDWSKLHTSTGDAASIPERLIKLIESRNEDEAVYWYFLLENYVVVSGGVYDSALACVNVLIAALKTQEMSEYALGYVLELIYQILNGVPDISEVERGNNDIVTLCKSFVLENKYALRGNSNPFTGELIDLINKITSQGTQ